METKSKAETKIETQRETIIKAEAETEKASKQKMKR